MIDGPHRPNENPKSNFVSPARRTDRITPMPATEHIEQYVPPSPGQTAEILKTTHVDRAKAFSIRTHQMSWVTSALSVVGALALGARGLLPLLLVALIGYFCVWGWAFWIDTQTSPGGVARYNSRRAWDEIREINRARVDAFRRVNGIEED